MLSHLFESSILLDIDMMSTRLKHLLVFLMLLMSGQPTFRALPSFKVNYSAKPLFFKVG